MSRAFSLFRQMCVLYKSFCVFCAVQIWSEDVREWPLWTSGYAAARISSFNFFSYAAYTVSDTSHFVLFHFRRVFTTTTQCHCCSVSSSCCPAGEAHLGGCDCAPDSAWLMDSSSLRAQPVPHGIGVTQQAMRPVSTISVAACGHVTASTTSYRRIL